MRSLRTSVAFLAVVALAAACTAAQPGWTYAPAPSATPLPSASASGSVEPSASTSASPSASASASASPSASAGSGTIVDISASSSTAFDQASVTAPADQAFVIHFANTESGIPHNVEVKDAGGASLMRGEPIITGPAEADYNVPALAAGQYTFVCSVHPNMTGTLTAE
jgi:plastocyanin